MPVRYLINTVLVVLLFFALQALSAGVLSTYQNKVLLLVGINIILAVSLNVATGYLGQLPLGHAGFMAEGAHAHPPRHTSIHPPRARGLFWAAGG